MIPSFLITFREVLEASLIVATILGILKQLNNQKGIRTVWTATGFATLVSILLLVVSSFLGVKIQTVYTGKVEEIIEGTLMIVSAIFITTAVFFLHKYFSRHKIRLIQKIKSEVEGKHEQKGLFILAFTAVFREGFEIILFLSTIYFSSEPVQIFYGFVGGLVGGLCVSLALFTATFRMPIYFAFRATSLLLILFAGGLLTRGVHELIEGRVLSEMSSIHISIFPQQGTFAADILKAIFGLTRNMDLLQVALYLLYITIMFWWVFLRKNTVKITKI